MAASVFLTMLQGLKTYHSMWDTALEEVSQEVLKSNFCWMKALFLTAVYWGEKFTFTGNVPHLTRSHTYFTAQGL